LRAGNRQNCIRSRLGSLSRLRGNPIGCLGWFKSHSHSYRKKGAEQTVRHFCATIRRNRRLCGKAARQAAITANFHVKRPQTAAVR
jgi:hypothetical protein